ncbi:MAG: U32 family peptidase [Erysipelotrichales bacterium]|nr:U32 family peptidase [Erysipelotrichales bacterium]
MSKILVNINKLEEIEEYKKIGITNFLFAIEGFSIGYKTFALSDIPEFSYLLINRVLDTSSVDKLASLKDEIKRFKGIIYEDIAVYQLFKNEDIELIWFQNHFTTNYASINYWLNSGCISAVISNEITESEINEIFEKSNKPLILNILGKNQIMYSRRKLLTNFNTYNNLSDYNNMTLLEPITNNKFKASESDYGTVISDSEYFNYVPLMNTIDDTKIKYYLILNQDLSVIDIKEILEGKEFGNTGFLNKKTVYRMSEYNDR